MKPLNMQWGIIHDTKPKFKMMKPRKVIGKRKSIRLNFRIIKRNPHYFVDIILGYYFIPFIGLELRTY